MWEHIIRGRGPRLGAMLCSTQAGYITGQSLIVDGGITVGLF